MIADINKVTSWPFEKGHSVCICGSGPAGMTVARELASKGVKVLLLEAGGFDLTSESQEIYDGKSIGPLEYFGVSACRLRMFGGTSNHWSGRCGIFERVDFEPRDIWGLPGWPISYDEAYRRLDDAREILDIADQSLAPREERSWRDSRFTPAGYARSGPTRFGDKYREELEASKLIDVALNANVIGATFDDNGASVAALIVSDYQDRRYAVEADHFVIAFGAIENARFLLNLGENSGVNVGGGGDGFVGRCFMEHFDINLGRFTSFADPLWERDDAIALNVPAELTKARGIGTAVVSVQPTASPRFYGRLAPLRRIANEISCAGDQWSPSGSASRSNLCRGDGVVTNIIEQTPNRDSRVVLDRSAQDRFGQHRISVDWRISATDVKTISSLAEMIGISLAAQNVARFQIAGDIQAGKPRPGFHCHQMGTTRMSSNPKDGVVDENSRVHGTKNLHIAGASVFPTGGGINPTLTIVCLALRLGEHIAKEVKNG